MSAWIPGCQSMPKSPYPNLNVSLPPVVRTYGVALRAAPMVDVPPSGGAVRYFQG